MVMLESTESATVGLDDALRSLEKKKGSCSELQVLKLEIQPPRCECRSEAGYSHVFPQRLADSRART